VSQMDAVLTVDTAALHIAGSLHIPTLGLFGLTDGSVRTSNYPTVEYIQGDVDCSPCLSVQEAPPCTYPWCKAYTDLDPDKVASRLMEVYHEHNQGNDE